MGVVREVPDFIDTEQRRAGVGPQPSVQSARGFLSREIEDEIGRGE